MKRHTTFPKQITIFLVALALLVTSTLGSLCVLVPAYAYTEKSGYVSVGSDTLNVRSGPGTSYSKIDELSTGTTVTIIGEDHASDGALWYQIRYSGSQTGYVHSQYIKIIETADPDPDFEASIAAFPESYKQSLRALHAQYPNWKFIPVETGLDWNEAVDAECVLGRSLIATGSISSWKSTQAGAYNWETGQWIGLDGSAWVQASREITAYYMDPRTYLDGNYVFVFLDYSYDASSQTLDGLKRIVAGTFLEGSFTEGGVTYQYPETIMEVAGKTGMNPYVMASMINVEIGSKGTSNSISGTLPGYEGLYNYYNIGAYATGSFTAIERGLWYAGGAGAGYTSYGRPWNTRYKAIEGGAQFYAENYVNKGQNTLYLKKFNVTGNPPYTHQYMTNVQGAATEARVMSKAYDEATRAAELVFKIPIYKNMPAAATVKPTGDGSPNNKLASLGVAGYSLTPHFAADELVYDVVVEHEVTSITIEAAPMVGSAKIDGTGTFELRAGVNTFHIVVTAENGQARTYQVNVAGSGGVVEPPEETTPEETTPEETSPEETSPEETTPEETTPEETSPEETTPEETTQSQATLNTTFQVSAESGRIHGLTKIPMSAEDFVAALGVEGGSAQVLKTDGSVQTGNVGTGNVVQIRNSAGELQAEYRIMIYGDTDGDGRIGGLDLLYVKKHLLNARSLVGIGLEAADLNGNGRIDGIDLLQLQKHLLGASTISQVKEDK